MNGEVIGINTSIYSRSGGSEGVGFSIPSNTAKKVKEQLLGNAGVYAGANARVSRGYLGVSLRDPQTAGSGAVVAELTSGGPASTAGLRGGDLIVEFDGKPVKSPKQLAEIVADEANGVLGTDCIQPAGGGLISVIRSGSERFISAPSLSSGGVLQALK